MNTRTLAKLAIGSCVVLGSGLAVRHQLGQSATPVTGAPPSEATSMQQLSQGAQLRRDADFRARRAAAVAPLVEWLPDRASSGVRWGADSVLSAGASGEVVLLRSAPAADSAFVSAAHDSLARDWLLAVARGPSDEVLSVAGAVGGTARMRCGDFELAEYLLGVTLHPRMLGAGLFDLDGRTVGMVLRCDQRLAAVPAGEVRRLLAAAGAVPARLRQRFGVTLAPLDARAATQFGADSGLLVTRVRLGSVADAAGLRPGDVVVAADGRPLTSVEALRPIAESPPAARHVLLRRRGARVAPVTLAAPAGAARGDELGVRVGPAGSPGGVELGEVRPGSRAARSGLRAGDRLVSVGGLAVTDAAAARDRLSAAAAGWVVVERDGELHGLLLVP